MEELGGEDGGVAHTCVLHWHGHLTWLDPPTRVVLRKQTKTLEMKKARPQNSVIFFPGIYI